MSYKRNLTDREQVFVRSLVRHGFRCVWITEFLKYNQNYIIPAPRKEDSGGVDFFIKFRKSWKLHPVQITQLGVKHYKRHRNGNGTLAAFLAQSLKRLKNKRICCKHASIAFIVVCDTFGTYTTPQIAKSDVQALRRTIRSQHR